MVLPEIPGIIVGANSGRASRCDLAELTIDPEHVGRALAAMKFRAMADVHQP
jgi:hypothetical protein